MVAYGSMSGGNLGAVDRVVEAVREMDRYHGFFPRGDADPVPLGRLAPPAKALALAAPTAMEMTPQTFEKARFGDGNGERPGARRQSGGGWGLRWKWRGKHLKRLNSADGNAATRAAALPGLEPGAAQLKSLNPRAKNASRSPRQGALVWTARANPPLTASRKSQPIQPNPRQIANLAGLRASSSNWRSTRSRRRAPNE